MKSFAIYLVVVTAVSLSACVEPILPGEDRAHFGWLPIQVPEDSLRVLRLYAPFDARSSAWTNVRDYVDSVPEVRQGSLLLRLDSLQGIDVFSTSAGTIVDRIGFFSVPGITQIRVVSTTAIEVNNVDDLVTLNTRSSPFAELEREAGVVPFAYPDGLPAVANSADPSFPEVVRYFQCADSTRGVLLGWRLSFSSELDCYLIDG